MHELELLLRSECQTLGIPYINAPNISNAVTGYAAQLSLGVSVMEYLKIPH